MKLHTDMLAAAIIIGLGAASLFMVKDLPVGSVVRMGAGFMPRGISILLIVLGAIIGLRAAVVREAEYMTIEVRPLLFILGSVLVFAVGINLIGLGLTSFFVVFLASFASRESPKLAQSLLWSAFLAVATVVIFPLMLSVPIPIWPQW